MSNELGCVILDSDVPACVKTIAMDVVLVETKLICKYEYYVVAS
jgi:hypothetical protein